MRIARREEEALAAQGMVAPPPLRGIQYAARTCRVHHCCLPEYRIARLRARTNGNGACVRVAARLASPRSVHNGFHQKKEGAGNAERPPGTARVPRASLRGHTLVTPGA